MKIISKTELAELLKTANNKETFIDDNGFVYLSKNKAAEKLEDLEIQEYGMVHQNITDDVLEFYSECISLRGRLYYPETLLINGFYVCTGLNEQ